MPSPAAGIRTQDVHNKKEEGRRKKEEERRKREERKGKKEDGRGSRKCQEVPMRHQGGTEEAQGIYIDF